MPNWKKKLKLAVLHLTKLGILLLYAIYDWLYSMGGNQPQSTKQFLPNTKEGVGKSQHYFSQ